MAEYTPNLNLVKPAQEDFYDVDDHNYNSDILDEEIPKKVDKVEGKQLSTEDYTAEEKAKLAGIEAQANKYVHPSSHSADILIDGATNKTVSATEKNAWNAKETPDGAQAKANAAGAAALSAANDYTDQAAGAAVTAAAGYTAQEVGALAGEGNTTTVKALEERQTSHEADYSTFKGQDNDDIADKKSYTKMTDTRNINPTAWDADSRPTTIEVRDGTTVIATLTITYNANGKITELVEVVDGNTITYTQTFDGATGKFIGRTKAVV